MFRIAKAAQSVTKTSRFFSQAQRTSKPVQKGVVSPVRDFPAHIQRPPYALPGGSVPNHPPPQIHDENGQKAMRAAGAAARDFLAYAGTLVVPGVTTDDIDRQVHEFSIKRGIYPSPLGYMGFPKTICTSINEVVCHGIPDDRVIEEGDVVSIDASCFVNGYHGDTCRTFIAGKADPAAERLVAATKEALNAGIAAAGPGLKLSAVGQAIEDVCRKTGYSSVRQYCGHGIGTVFHTMPLVYHFANDLPDTLVPGMTFTIEPMLVEGSAEVVMWDDAWTVATAHGGWCAQFEHTLLVTEHGIEVLTDYEMAF